MNINEFINSESVRYPEYVTQKQMAAMLGVCKSKAYAIQKRGYIPFTYTSTAEGRRQKIKTADILRYQFEQMSFSGDAGNVADVLYPFFKKQLSTYPQILFVTDINRFTGYSHSTINNWIDRDLLKALCYKNQKIRSPRLGKGTLITKEAFIEFLVCPYYRNIRRKSTLHSKQAQDYEKLIMSFLSKRGDING